jgi:hypothetical protein
MRSLLTDPARLQKYFSTFYVSVFAAAVAWGSMLFAFPHRQFDFVYMFKIIALAAINSVTILSHGLIFRLYALFSTVMTVMVLIQLHGFDRVMSASDRNAFSGIALLYLLFLLLTAWKYARRNFDFFEQQVAMESLVSKLKRLHDEEVDCAPAWRPSPPGWKRRAMPAGDCRHRQPDANPEPARHSGAPATQVDKVSHAEGSFCVHYL